MHDIGLEEIAEKVCLTASYVSFIFKKETGMNLNRFIRVFRMKKAKELLRTTNMKVAMVSEKVGFTNSSYFCRSFRCFRLCFCRQVAVNDSGTSKCCHSVYNGDDEEKEHCKSAACYVEDNHHKDIESQSQQE